MFLYSPHIPKISNVNKSGYALFSVCKFHEQLLDVHEKRLHNRLGRYSNHALRLPVTVIVTFVAEWYTYAIWYGTPSSTNRWYLLICSSMILLIPSATKVLLIMPTVNLVHGNQNNHHH